MGFKWIAKAAVQKSISFLPNPENINLLFQRYVTKGVELNEEHFTFKITHAKDHIDNLRRVNQRHDNEILELGTGWYPIVPIAFFLTDCGQVTSVDIQDWLKLEGIIATIAKMQAWDRAGKLRPYLPGFREERWEALLKIADVAPSNGRDWALQQIGLQPILGDARQLSFSDNHFDFICSNNTFEHVHADVLKGILREFKRLIKADGLMSHFIDLSDHFAHFDQSITIYNFLRFSKKQWQLIDNSIQPQNRLRWKDYLNMYAQLDIPTSPTGLRLGDLEALSTVSVHPEFSEYSPEELAISHGYMVSQF